MPMMGLGIYGDKGSLQADFTDQRGGELRYVLAKFGTRTTATVPFVPDTEGAFGHGRTVVRYLRHFEDCLENDREPSPGAREGARSIATCAAAWESVHTGQVVRVRNDF